MINTRRPNRILSIAIALVAATLACSSPNTSTPPIAATPPLFATPTPGAAPILDAATLQGAVSGQKAYDHTKQLADVIGPRPTGTQKERDAANYIAGVLLSLGYNVTQPPFTFQGYKQGDASLQVNSSSTSITPQPLYLSPGGDVTGSLVAAGIGNPQDFPSQSLAGKIALIQRGTITFNDKVTNAGKAGAAAVILYNNVPGAFDGSLAAVGATPAVSISQQDGNKLLELMKQGDVQVHLKLSSGYEDIRSQNVVTSNAAPCKIVIGGHYDSVAAGPGANDNASGTSAMLELARVFKDSASQLGVCFAAFGAEELGLWGSKGYVKSLTDEQKAAIKAMINLDMVGVGTSWRITASPAILAQVQAAATTQGATAREFGETQRGGSDHASFTAAGIPAVFFYRSEDPNYHSPEDTAQFIDPMALDAVGKMAVQLVMSLVGG